MGCTACATSASKETIAPSRSTRLLGDESAPQNTAEARCAHSQPPRRHPPRRAAHPTPPPLGSSPCFHSAAVGAASTTRARCAVTTVPIAGRACATLAGLASTAHSICALGAALVMGGAPTRDASATRASRGATARSPHVPGTVQAMVLARWAGVGARRAGLTPIVGCLLTLFGQQPPRVSGCQRATPCAKRRARHQGRLRAMDETFCISEARRGRRMCLRLSRSSYVPTQSGRLEEA